MPPVKRWDHTRSIEITTLIYAIFVAGLCSIVYELLIATTVATFKGDTVTWFSLTIGLYMAAMGAGAFLSKFLIGNLLRTFVIVEIALGVFGALSVPALHLAWTLDSSAIIGGFGPFNVAYVAFTVAIGILIGLEIPLLTRILQGYAALRVNIAHVLSLDYVGALAATLAFPFLLLPFLGTFRASLVLGLVNMTIALLIAWCFRERIGGAATRSLQAASVSIVAAVGLVLVASGTLLDAWTQNAYGARVLHAERTPYQWIVLTKDRHDLRLYLDGNLQFSSLDEHRYHEALVHVPMLAAIAGDASPKRVLVLGGGDGLAVRELLKYPTLEQITLVDLDPAVLDLARTSPHLTSLNANSLHNDRRVRVIAADVVPFLAERSALWDVIIADLPDPNNHALARLYTVEFYSEIAANLSPDGVFAVQATSPFFARRAFWGIHASIASVFAHTAPYHALVPSFGDWGFVLASRDPIPLGSLADHLAVPTRFLDQDAIAPLFVFGKDLQEPKGDDSVPASTLDRLDILADYLDGWRQWPR